MSALKSTVIYLPGIFIPRAMSLALLIIMTHFLPKADYGLMTLVITVGELVDTSLTTWVRLALLRLGGGGAISSNLAAAVLKMVAVTTTAGCAISFALAWFLVSDRYLEFWLAVASYTLGISLLRFGLALLQLEGRAAEYSVIEIVRSLTSFVLATGAAHFLGPTFINPSLALSLTTCAFALATIRRGTQRLRPSDIRYGPSAILAFAGPLLILSVMTIVANTMDRLFLQSWFGAAAVGAYAATYALARQPIDVIANAINTGGYPALVTEFERGGREQASRFMQGQLAFFLKFIVPVVCVLFTLRADLLAALLPPGYFAQGDSVFGVILLASLAFNLRSCIFDNIFLVERKNMLQLRYFVIVFAIGVVVAFWVVPAYGGVGAGIVFLTWTTLAVGMSALFGRRLIPIALRWADGARVAVISAVCVVLAAGAQTLLLAEPAFVRLIAGGTAAGVGFLGSMAALHAGQTRDLVRNAHRRLRRAGA